MGLPLLKDSRHARRGATPCASRRPALLFTPDAWASLRALHSVTKSGPSTEDPVDEIEATLLESFGRDELCYATCPACGVQNREGVAKDRAEQRATRFGGAGVLAVVSAASYFVPLLALLVPVFGLVMVVLVVVMARRRAEPWARALVQLILPVGLGVLIVLVPRLAFAVPMLLGIWFLVRTRSPGAERFEQASKRLHFHRTPYREASTRAESPQAEQPRFD